MSKSAADEEASPTRSILRAPSRVESALQGRSLGPYFVSSTVNEAAVASELLRQYVTEPAWRITRIVSGTYPAAISFLAAVKNGVVDTHNTVPSPDKRAS